MARDNIALKNGAARQLKTNRRSSTVLKALGFFGSGLKYLNTTSCSLHNNKCQARQRAALLEGQEDAQRKQLI